METYNTCFEALIKIEKKNLQMNLFSSNTFDCIVIHIYIFFRNVNKFPPCKLMVRYIVTRTICICSG